VKIPRGPATVSRELFGAIATVPLMEWEGSRNAMICKSGDLPWIRCVPLRVKVDGEKTALPSLPNIYRRLFPPLGLRTC